MGESGLDVPIRAMLANEYGPSFAPEEVANLSAAFDAALTKLGLVDRKDPATISVARLIIEVAKSGERDPERLCENALKILGK